jgi:hypothetical protein
MEQSLWEANSHSASQEIPHILWNPRIHYHVHLPHACYISRPFHPCLFNNSHDIRCRKRGSSVWRVTRLRAKRPRFDSRQGWGFFFLFSPRPDRLWDPPRLLSNGYQGPFPRGQSSLSMKLTTHLQLAPRLRTRGAIPQLQHTSS